MDHIWNKTCSKKKNKLYKKRKTSTMLPEREGHEGAKIFWHIFIITLVLFDQG